MDRRNTRFYTLQETADLVPVSRRVLRNEIEKNKLVARKIGGRYYIAEDDFIEYLNKVSTAEKE